MAWYNLTAVDATNILTFAQSINESFMFNQLGNLLLVVIFFISFISLNLYYNDPKFNLAVASFVVAVFSVMFFIFNFVPGATPFICWGIYALALVGLLLSR